MEIRVLGPIEVIGDDGPVRLAGAMQRRLLAALVSQPGQTRSCDGLIDALWGPSPPPSARKLLQVYVSQLRKVLPTPARIVTRNAGYALEIPADSIDAFRLERLLGEARAIRKDNPRLALSLLERALQLCRGQPYADVAYEDFAQVEAERLDELRRTAIEERLESLLTLGRHEEVLTELSSLALSTSTQEHLQALTMLALYRSGRQTDALDVYATFRMRLHDELGLEPGPELRDLQRRILEQDPSLDAPPVRDSAPLATLPTPPNRLHGRERELEELHGLLGESSIRLLVLTGAGGSGKTRLALEVAHRAASSFANGVAFVSLASLRDPDLMLGETARVLGVELLPEQSPLEALVLALRSQELLLVLDNLEHLRSGTPGLVELLSQAPRVRVLVTSRVVLHLSGEHVYPIDPLEEEAGVELFVERARGAEPDIRVGANDLETVRRICERVDRLPLAIELAASHVRALDLSEILARLDPRLPLLVGGPRDLPARQQTLRGTLEWSVELLDEATARDLGKLAVFAGGCTLAAAEVVCRTTSERLESLIDHNLVTRAQMRDGSRYSMLETIREYAAELIAVEGDDEAMRGRHAAYFCELAEEAEGELEGGPAQATWLRTLDTEHDNIRAALEWSLSRGDAVIGARIATSLWRYWYSRGHIVEGRRWIERALAGDVESTPSLEIRLLKAGAIVDDLLGNLEGVATKTERRLALAQTEGDDREIAACLNNLGLLAWSRGDIKTAEELLRASVARFKEAPKAPSRVGVDVPLGNLARIALITGDLTSAQALANESMDIARARADPEQIWDMVLTLSMVFAEQGKVSDALRLGRQAFVLADDLDSTVAFYASCRPLAILLAREGLLRRAAQVLGKRKALENELGRTSHFDFPALERAEAEIRRGLTHETYVEELAAGAMFDVRVLLDLGFREAEAAASPMHR